MTSAQIKSQMTVSGLSKYIETVQAYADQTAADELSSKTLQTTKTELVMLKNEVITAQMVLPEHSQKYAQLVDRAEAIAYQSGIFGEQF